MVGAHTDSPCLKVKPKSRGVKNGHAMLNIETYGGGLWATWFDRDLSVAGRLLVRGKDGSLQHKLASASSILPMSRSRSVALVRVSQLNSKQSAGESGQTHYAHSDACHSSQPYNWH